MRHLRILWSHNINVFSGWVPKHPIPNCPNNDCLQAANEGRLSTLYELQPAQGYAYNWYAAYNYGTGLMQNLPSSNGQEGEGDPNEIEQGPQGICPKGWHLPSDKEWNRLEKEIATHPDKYTIGNNVPHWDDAWATMLGESRGTHAQLLLSGCPMTYGGISKARGKSLPAAAGGFDALQTWMGGTAMFWTASSAPKPYVPTGAYTRRILQGYDFVERGVVRWVDHNTVRCKKDVPYL